MMDGWNNDCRLYVFLLLFEWIVFVLFFSSAMNFTNLLVLR